MLGPVGGEGKENFTWGGGKNSKESSACHLICHEGHCREVKTGVVGGIRNSRCQRERVWRHWILGLFRTVKPHEGSFGQRTGNLLAEISVFVGLIVQQKKKGPGLSKKGGVHAS